MVVGAHHVFVLKRRYQGNQGRGCWSSAVRARVQLSIGSGTGTTHTKCQLHQLAVVKACGTPVEKVMWNAALVWIGTLFHAASWALD